METVILNPGKSLQDGSYRTGQTAYVMVEEHAASGRFAVGK